MYSGKREGIARALTALHWGLARPASAIWLNLCCGRGQPESAYDAASWPTAKMMSEICTA